MDLLTKEERIKFSEYLKQSINDDRLIIEQSIKVNTKGSEMLANHLRIEMNAKIVVANILDKTEDI